MLKGLRTKNGLYNEEVSDAEVFDTLVEHFRDLKFTNHSSGRMLNIMTRSGIAKIQVSRGRDGIFQFGTRIALIYYLFTFGLIELFEDLAGKKKMREIRDFLRERFHVEGKY